MKNVMVLFLVVTLNTVEAYSQNSQDEDSASFHKKRWALQFQIERDFTLNSFQGSIISLKKTLSQKSAVRVGVSFWGALHNDDTKYSLTPPDTVHHEYKREISFFDMNVLSQYIQYLPIEDKIAAYYGVGPTFGYSFNKYKNKEANMYGSNESHYTVTTTTNYWNVGVNAVFGVEWFVRKNMGLSAEYGAMLTYGNSKRDEKSEYTYSSGKFRNQNNSYQFSLGANMVKFGLSVYFE